jgi:hypothetical protein
MVDLDPSVWQRHEALATVARRHPVCAGAQPPSGAALDALLREAGHPWTLIDPVEVDGSYEATVARGCIPFREGAWHDVFNVLSFVSFPRAKAALHARVLECQRQREEVGLRRRSREEDALTLLDEAVIIVAGRAPGIARFDDLRARADLDRIDACIRTEALIVIAFGHALLEHLVHDRSPIGAGVCPLTIPFSIELSLAGIDTQLAAELVGGRFDRPAFGPSLPWPDERVQRWCR